MRKGQSKGKRKRKRKRKRKEREGEKVNVIIGIISSHSYHCKYLFVQIALHACSVQKHIMVNICRTLLCRNVPSSTISMYLLYLLYNIFTVHGIRAGGQIILERGVQWRGVQHKYVLQLQLQLQ